MKIKSLNDLMIEMIQDMYSAETQLAKGLEKMAKKASNKKLQDAFQTHLKETQEQAKRLEEVCKLLDVDPKAEKCEVMEALIVEAEEIIENAQDKDVLDAGLIASAQKVEHYEISSYGTILTYAKTLENKKIVDILSKTIEEEKKTDTILTEIAEKVINEKAMA